LSLEANKKREIEKMSKKLMLINADHPEECRVVILEDGKVDELIVEHASHEQIKGNIYLAVINRVEPSIEAAFLDIGSKKFGFLPFKDVRKDSYLQTGEKKAKIRIQDVLVRGQKLLVQVVKEGRDAKGPSLTNWISLPGRFLVLMVGQEASAVSRKIEDETERKKLKEIIADFDLPENMGVIIRTAGLGRTKLELQKDLQMLMKIWDQLEADMSAETTTAPGLLYREPNMVVRTVRDHFTADTSEIIVDEADAYKATLGFVKMVMPRLHRRVKFYKETKPLFSHYKVEQQIESIYDRTVQLPSGGSIVIDIGEAMVSIDVNSGKTTGASQLEETALNTNIEAANEIGRQLRLRDLGGLIVIDFIDMYQKKNKALVERELKLVCKKDKARINLARISKFGLMEMSRQRMSPPVKEGVFETCKLCKGSGQVKSVGALVLGMLRKIQETLAQGNVGLLAVHVSPEVADYMLKHKLKYLMELQEKHKFIIEFVSKSGLTYDNFAYNVLERKKDKVEEVERDGKAREGRPEAGDAGRRITAPAKEERFSRNNRRRGSRNGPRPSGAPDRGNKSVQGENMPVTATEVRPSEAPEQEGKSVQGENMPVTATEVRPSEAPEQEGKSVQSESMPITTTEVRPSEAPEQEGKSVQSENDDGKSSDQRAKPVARKRFTRRKTSSRRTSPYRGRKSRVEKTDDAQGRNEVKPDADGNRKTEVDGNVREASPVVSARPLHVENSVPLARPRPSSENHDSGNKPPKEENLF
jgi:ribonuclease E